MLSATETLGAFQIHSMASGGNTDTPAMTVQPVADSTPTKRAIRVIVAIQSVIMSVSDDRGCMSPS